MQASPGVAKVVIKDDGGGLRTVPDKLARLISKSFHADPLTCRRCGAKLKIVAFKRQWVRAW